jgi:hypothetical protein
LRIILVLFCVPVLRALQRSRATQIAIVSCVIIYAALRGLGVFGYQVYWGILGGGVLWLTSRKESLLDPLGVIFVATLVAALGCGLMSSIGNLAPALAPAFCLAVLWLSEMVEVSATMSRATAVGSLAVSLLPLVVLSAKLSKSIVTDFGPLSTVVRQGPFEGLVANPERRQYLEEVWAEIRRAERESPDARLWVTSFCPYAYLVSRLRPATPSVYHCLEPGLREACLDSVRRSAGVTILARPRSDSLEPELKTFFEGATRDPAEERIFEFRRYSAGFTSR